MPRCPLHTGATLLIAILLTGLLVSQSPATDDREALLEAARTGDAASVTTLLDRGVDVNAASRYGVTPLSYAADRGHLEIVRLLVTRGATLDVADSFYLSRPIDFALRGGHLAVAMYLLERGSPGAVGVLNAGIRSRDEAAVKAALATRQADATSLAAAAALAAQSGDATIAALVKAAAAEAPSAPRPSIALDPAVLRGYEGRYQSATSGAEVTVALDGETLTLTAEGQPTLRLQAIETRRFTVMDTPETTVTFAGRGGIVERLSVARGPTSVRYEREGFGDATSPAPAPASDSNRPSTRLSSAAVSPAPASARRPPAPWPAFRGANAAGAADGQGVVTEWDVTAGRHVRWKTPIPGLATSSPIVWGDRVFLIGAASASDTSFRTGLYGDVKPVDDLSTHRFHLYALNQATGAIVWQREVFSGPPRTKRHTKSSQANATPVTDGRYVVAVFGSIGLMVCYDINGALVWRKDLGVLDSGWFLDPSYQWGHASSPIIYGSSVIVQADQARGSFLAAFDLATGRELWRTARDEVSTWGTPTVLFGARGDELVTNGTKVRGYDPATGALVWTLGPNSEISIGTPVVHRNLVIVTAGYPPVRPVYAVRAGARGDISLPQGRSSSDAVAWSHDRDGTYISTPIVYRDQLYTLNHNGILTAYSVETGERVYRARVGGGGAFSASPVAADGRLYLASEDGDVFVVQAGREYAELARNAMGEVIMASPAIADGLLIIRTLGHVWGIGR
ncbi:MAG: outer membrane protein assembly factor BamB family protein [Acidobacteriota bacterium]